jgi:hypothetical protein
MATPEGRLSLRTVEGKAEGELQTDSNCPDSSPSSSPLAQGERRRNQAAAHPFFLLWLSLAFRPVN